MTKIWMVLAALALLCACSHKKTAAEQLGDLDKAYQGGAVTKQEYDAKKAAIIGAPAPAPVPTPDASPAAPGSITPASPSQPEPVPAQNCEDAQTTRKDSGPETRFYPRPLADVKKAALDAFSTLDFTVHSEEGNEIDASKKRTKKSAIVGAGGERVNLQFGETIQDGRPGTMVTAATKKGGLVGQKSWTTAVLAQIGCNLR